jgi:drug/metabolite transporter (DMT)-like permease
MFLFVLLAAVLASHFTISKEALYYASPTFIIGIRMVCVGIIFLSAYFIRHGSFKVVRTLDWWLFIRIILCLFSLNHIFLLWSLQYMVSAKAALLCSSAPMVSAIFSYFLFKESITIKKVLGLAISFIGFIPEVVASSYKEGDTLFFVSWPEAVLFCSVILLVYGRVLLRVALRDHRVPVDLVNGLCTFIGGIISLSFAFWFSYNKMFVARDDLDGIKLVFLLTIIIGIGVLLAVFYGYLIKKYTTPTIAFGELLAPIFAALYGWFLLEECVNWYFYVSVATILTGMYLFYAEERRLGYVV